MSQIQFLLFQLQLTKYAASNGAKVCHMEGCTNNTGEALGLKDSGNATLV